ncbi:hypothetical protein [Sagittula sp. MA-2]|jgi:hypothetical protein|uniref:hypothetical protein n=1 Tax=Sagittula sp. MA-2 TaxID=3048007 RepID=UPI0024C3C4BE|nr:hypothetical protein [Sagittula sp. MA-2]WHZ35732.1 hypothetical protein QNI11_01710 [Sagittula sp. MA-2]
MTEHHPILAEIDAFLSESGMSDTYFGKKSVNNSELVPRLRAGGGMHFTTEARIRDFLRSQATPSPEAAE